MFSLLTTKKNLLNTWVALFLFLFVAMAVNPDAKAESEGIEHRNKLSLFGGVTQESSDFGASLGLEYEYRLSQFWSINGLLEYVGGDFDAWVIGFPVSSIHMPAGSSAYPLG